MDTKRRSQTRHHGHNIQTFRVVRGLSQAGLAASLEEATGKSISQQYISDLEKTEDISDDALMDQIAAILKVDPQILKEADLESNLMVSGNTFTTNDHASPTNLPIYTTINQTINPPEKLIEYFSEREKKLEAEIETLREKIKVLEARKK